jgi:hypothetical protein
MTAPPLREEQVELLGQDADHVVPDHAVVRVGP